MQTDLQKLSNRELDAAIAVEVFGWESAGDPLNPFDHTKLVWFTELLERLVKKEDVLLMQRDCAGWSIEWARMEMFIADDCPTLQRAVAEAALMVARQEAKP